MEAGPGIDGGLWMEVGPRIEMLYVDGGGIVTRAELYMATGGSTQLYTHVPDTFKWGDYRDINQTCMKISERLMLFAAHYIEII